MTKVLVTLNNNTISNISITGHAEFALSGKDICCAAISTTAFYTINAISHFGNEKNINVNINEKNGEMHIKVLDVKDDIVQKFMQLLKLHLLEIEKQFPNNIQIKEK